MNSLEAYRALKDVLPQIPRKSCGRGNYGKTFYRRIGNPVAERRKYRGKDRCIVGYGWTRPYSHYASGLVYDCIMGYGETFEEAIAMMKRKVKP